MRRLRFRARAPLRLGFAGGGTDLSAYSNRFGGAVLNATIDRYAYAFLEPRDDDQICFDARDIGVHETLSADGPFEGRRLALHGAVYNAFIRRGARPRSMTVTTTVDSPPGAGLGSSSALVVALTSCFARYFDVGLGLYDLAHLAYEIERQDLAMPGGKQDQYAAAFGGVNFIEFIAGDRVIVNPLRVNEAVLNEIESSLIICFSGLSRTSDQIIRTQVARLNDDDPSSLDAMHRLKEDAITMKAAFLSGDIDLLAEILGRSWKTKQATAGNISNTQIERLIERALDAGALAGKVSGAGGGGFMMFIVRPEDRLDVIRALDAEGGNASPVKFTFRGSETWIANQ